MGSGHTLLLSLQVLDTNSMISLSSRSVSVVVINGLLLVATRTAAFSLILPFSRTQEAAGRLCRHSSFPPHLMDRIRLQSIRIRAQEDSTDLALLEKEVVASVQERLDVKRIVEALEEEGGDMSSSALAPRWKIAFAGASVTSIISFIFVNANVYFALAVWVAVFLVANNDPVEEDNVAGPLVRILGRTMLRSVEASQPKIKALTRALVTGEEVIVLMKDRIAELEDENEDLRLWKLQRLKVDENLSKFTMDELKDLARPNGLKVGGSKSELCMRLVEAQVLKLD
jgi:hypothetical protein